MSVSRTRQSLVGAIWAALIFAPGLCSAQPAGDTGPKGGSNLTRQTQSEIDIALPSLAPLVERVMPAVVNISVELKEQAAAEGEENTGKEGASPFGPSGTPFDQFLKRFFEQPFELRGSVTAGIVSALGRNINEGPYDDFLQIDAPINRGNSGGPTFNLHGQVIGINTAIYSPSGGSVGIGFAVPSNIVKHVVAQLKEHGHVTWGWLGIAIQSVTPAIAKSLGLDPDHPSGALVASVTAESPAARAGIKQGDLITAASGHEIKSVHDLPRLVAATPVYTKLQLTIVRDGKQSTVEAAIGEMPQNVASAEREPAEPGSGKSANALGMELLPLDPQLRKELKIPKDLNGVVVGQVTSGSPAGELGIRPGDVIVSVDQSPVTTPEGAAAQLKQAAAQGNVLLLLNRHGMSQFVGLSIENNGTAGSSR